MGCDAGFGGQEYGFGARASTEDGNADVDAVWSMWVYDGTGMGLGLGNMLKDAVENGRGMGVAMGRGDDGCGLLRDTLGFPRHHQVDSRIRCFRAPSPYPNTTL